MIKVGNRQYSLGSTLGVGGFSEVKKGVDSETRKRVALKIMYTDKSQSPQELKSQLVQVQKEIKAMKQLNHPNIIRLLGYDLKCTVNNRSAIVMVQQLAPKGELFDYLMYTQKFPQNQAISLFHQLVRGIQAMHDVGIAHRDLKPENLLFDNSYNLKLADFGFSFVYKKGEGPKTAMRTELGTKGYMSPEILAQKKYTEKADIFAAGVILFIMLAGFPPFQNAVSKDWWFDKLQKKKYKLFWMAHERTASFSPEAKDILQKMLAPREAERLNIYEVQQQTFFQSDCLTKEDLVAELKDRKRTVDTQKRLERKEREEEITSRDLFSEILVREGPLLPDDQPILLRDVMQNDFSDQLKGVQTQEELMEVLGNEMDLRDMVEMRKKAAEFSPEQLQEVSNKLADCARYDTEKIQEEVSELGLTTKVAEIIQSSLRTVKIGKIDDWDKLEKFRDFEADVTLPTFSPYKLKNHTYTTKIGLGVLGYCVEKFMHKRGKMTITKTPAPAIICHFKTKHTVQLPEEKDNGEIGWREGKLPVTVKIELRIFYDEEFKTNVITFANVSDDVMAMHFFPTIVQEITTNNTYFLASFLNDTYKSEEAEVSDMCLDDIEFDEEEEVEGQQ